MPCMITLKQIKYVILSFFLIQNHFSTIYIYIFFLGGGGGGFHSVEDHEAHTAGSIKVVFLVITQ